MVVDRRCFIDLCIRHKCRSTTGLSVRSCKSVLSRSYTSCIGGALRQSVLARERGYRFPTILEFGTTFRSYAGQVALSSLVSRLSLRERALALSYLSRSK